MLYLIMTFVIPLWVRKIKSKIRSRSIEYDYDYDYEHPPSY